jgi:hypothetical protein
MNFYNLYIDSRSGPNSNFGVFTIKKVYMFDFPVPTCSNVITTEKFFIILHT